MRQRRRLLRALLPFLRRSEGNMAVEFAIIAPTLLLFLFGLIEFSRYAYTQSSLNFAAQDATRFAVVRGGERLELHRNGSLSVEHHDEELRAAL